MGITIGIDIGGSTTKIIGIKDSHIIMPLLVKATDPVASLFGAFGKFIADNGFTLSDVQRVMLTGVGASFISKPIYGLPTAKVQEFLSIGLGGLYLSGFNKALIISMGTGTAMVKASDGLIEHIGGTGIGGGTILGLSGRMLNIRDIQLVIQTAENGNLSNIDLMVGDITSDKLPGLPSDATAANFGNINDLATKSDVALGILNLVFQSIGMSAIFAIKNTDIKNIVLTGNLTTIPQSHSIFESLGELFGVNFIMPEYSEYGTAVGAALAFVQDRTYTELL